MKPWNHSHCVLIYFRQTQCVSLHGFELSKDCIWHNIFGTYFLHRLLIKVCCWRIKFATIKTGKNNSPSCLFWRNRSLYIKKHHRPVHHGLASYILGPDIVNIIGKPILRSAAQLGLGWARKIWVWLTFFEQTIIAELRRANKKNWFWFAHLILNQSLSLRNIFWVGLESISGLDLDHH